MQEQTIYAMLDSDETLFEPMLNAMVRYADTCAKGTTNESLAHYWLELAAKLSDAKNFGDRGPQ